MGLGSFGNLGMWGLIAEGSAGLRGSEALVVGGYMDSTSLHYECLEVWLSYWI